MIETKRTARKRAKRGSRMPKRGMIYWTKRAENELWLAAIENETLVNQGCKEVL